jgi:hypothetical protein
VISHGGAGWRQAVAIFLFLLCFSLLLLPLAFRLFYCSSSFFPFSPLVLGKEMLMVMFFFLIFLCWVDVLTPGSSCLV